MRGLSLRTPPLYSILRSSSHRHQTSSSPRALVVEEQPRRIWSLVSAFSRWNRSSQRRRRGAAEETRNRIYQSNFLFVASSPTQRSCFNSNLDGIDDASHSSLLLFLLLPLHSSDPILHHIIHLTLSPQTTLPAHSSFLQLSEPPLSRLFPPPYRSSLLLHSFSCSTLRPTSPTSRDNLHRFNHSPTSTRRADVSLGLLQVRFVRRRVGEGERGKGGWTGWSWS